MTSPRTAEARDPLDVRQPADVLRDAHLARAAGHAHHGERRWRSCRPLVTTLLGRLKPGGLRPAAHAVLAQLECAAMQRVRVVDVRSRATSPGAAADDPRLRARRASLEARARFRSAAGPPRRATLRDRVVVAFGVRAAGPVSATGHRDAGSWGSPDGTRDDDLRVDDWRPTPMQEEARLHQDFVKHGGSARSVELPVGDSLDRSRP